MFVNFLNQIFELIIPVIVLCVIIGLVSFACAMYGVNKESRLLDSIQKKHEQGEPLLNPGSNRHDRIQQLKNWITSNNKNQELRVGDGRHMLMRLKTIHESVTQTSTAEIPSLHDLHTLTQQDEMSRPSFGTLRTITSFLLILGILGTLTGVHRVVGENSSAVIEISRLGTALKPSMWAVSFTILLMWLRGYYVACLNTYLEKLDLYTVTEIIPRLQPVSHLAGHAVDLGETIESLKDKIQSVKQMSKRMEAINKAVTEEVSKVDELVKTATKTCEELNGAQEKLCSLKDESAMRLRYIEQKLKAGANVSGHIKKDTQTLENNATELQNDSTVIEKQFNELKEHLSTSADMMRKGFTTLEMLKREAVHMSSVGTQVEEYKAQVESLATHTEKVKETLEGMESLKSEIMQAENITENSARIAEQVRRESESHFENLLTENTHFRQSVKSDSDELELKMAALTTLVIDVINAAKKVEEAEKRRAQVIGVTGS